MKKSPEKTVEIRVQVPMSIHHLLQQKQDNHRMKDLPFKPLKDFALEAMIDGLFKESFFEQMLRARMEKDA